MASRRNSKAEAKVVKVQGRNYMFDPVTGAMSFPKGSPSRAHASEAAYGLTVAQAEEMLETAEKTPGIFSPEQLWKARAMLAGIRSTPKVVSTKPAWVRPNSR